MRVPRSARAGLEGHCITRRASWRCHGEKRIDSHRTREPVVRTLSRLLRATSLDLHDGFLKLDHHLDCLPVVHGAVAVGHAVEIDHAVEDTARLDSAFHHVRHQLLDVSAGRSWPAGNRHVLEEGDVARWNRLVLRNADATDSAPRTGDADGGDHRIVEADALENRMRANAP